MINIDKQNGQTYRDICLVDGALVVLGDRRGLGPDPLESEANVADRVFSVIRPESELEAPVRGIVHTSAHPQPYVEDFFLENYKEAPPKTVLLRVSTSPEQKGNHSATDAVVWLMMKDGDCYRSTSEWLPQFLALDFETATEIANKPNRADLSRTIQENFDRFLDITHPGDPTAPFAFRRLCDAWAAVNLNGEKEFTAPCELDDWLSPFSPQSNGEKATTESVVAMMGDDNTKAKVSAVLEAADNDPTDAVTAFLNESNELTSTEGEPQ